MSLATPVITHTSGIEWTGQCNAWCATRDGGLPNTRSIAFISKTDGKDLASYSKNELEQGLQIPSVESGDDGKIELVQDLKNATVTQVIGNFTLLFCEFSSYFVRSFSRENFH